MSSRNNKVIRKNNKNILCSPEAEVFTFAKKHGLILILYIRQSLLKFIYKYIVEYKGTKSENWFLVKMHFIIEYK